MRAVPPNGFHFPDAGRVLVGDDYDSLITAIIDDRVKNRRPIGDPQKEYLAYVTAHWPHYSGSAAYVVKAGDPTNIQSTGNLRERVTQWLANRYSLRASGNETLLDETEAERRAQICQACPHNQEVPQDCPPCIKEVNRVSFVLREGRDTPTKVKACELMGHDNRAAVFLPEKMLAHRSQYKIPSNCWMRDL